MPTKSLYKIQVSVTSEVQSHARTDATDLQHMKNGKEVLELVVSQVKLETKEENKCVERLEQGLITMYNRITNNTQAIEKSTVENIDLIVHTIDQYRQDIKDLK